MKIRMIMLLILAITSSSQANTISQWTFESNPPANLNNSTTITGITADVGNGTASSVHASSATDWSTPVGNGSDNSLSANNWMVNDYFQFKLSTVGFTGIQVSFDQTSSGTGPGSFYFAYGTDGTSFTTLPASYTVSANSGSWSQSTAIIADVINFDLSGVGVLNDAADVYFRIIDATTDSAGGDTVSGTGTDRIDNFTVTGSVKSIETVPASMPTGFAAMILFALLLVLRGFILQPAKK